MPKHLTVTNFLDQIVDDSSTSTTKLLSAAKIIELTGGGGGGETNTASNIGAGTGIFAQKSTFDLEFKSLVAGTGVALSSDASTITVTNTSPGEVATATNVGAGSQVFKQKTGTQFQYRSLTAGSNITLTENANDIEISAAGGAVGETNTASNLGGFSEVFKQKIGVDLQFRSIKAGSNITVTQNANDIEIAATSGAGETNTASNVGSGSGVWKDKQAQDLRFKSLIASGVLSITSNANDLTFTSTAEANTASNISAGGSSIFKQKLGVDLQFRQIVAGTGIAVTENTNDITISATGGGGGYTYETENDEGAKSADFTIAFGTDYNQFHKKVTLGASVTMSLGTPTGSPTARKAVIRVVQDATGGRALDLGNASADIHTAGAIAEVPIDTTANAESLLVFEWFDSRWFLVNVVTSTETAV